MTSGISQHEQYAKSMKVHGIGHAFLVPESAEDVKPGACGYIDEIGQWRPTVDLSLPLDKPYTPIDELFKARKQTFQWGPKVSEATKADKLELETNLSGLAATIPADFSVHIRFHSTSDFGAVLICDGGVSREGYAHKDPFQTWAKQNALKLAQRFPNVKEHGFYIVTTTHATNDVLINTWSDKSNNVVVGFKAGVTGIGEVGPSTECYRAASASDWIQTKSEVSEVDRRRHNANETRTARPRRWSSSVVYTIGTESCKCCIRYVSFKCA
jgi:hypothetical protein